MSNRKGGSRGRNQLFVKNERGEPFCSRRLGGCLPLKSLNPYSRAASAAMTTLPDFDISCGSEYSEAIARPGNAIVESSIGLCLPKTPSELKTQRFRAFMRSWCDHDELSFRRPFRFCHLQFSNPYRPAGGDPRASSPTRGFPKERAAALAPPALRPALVGLALAIVARLAL